MARRKRAGLVESAWKMGGKDMLRRMELWQCLGLITVIVALGALACTREVLKEVPVEVVVEKEVIREVKVPGETVVVEKEVVKEVPK